MRVEITYLDGVQELVEDIPTAKMGSDIYTQGVMNGRSKSVVLYRSDGTVAQEYRLESNHPALRARDMHSVLAGASESARAALDAMPHQDRGKPACGRKWYPDGATGVFRSCKRVGGHLGMHADGVTFARSTVRWDDTECA